MRGYPLGQRLDAGWNAGYGPPRSAICPTEPDVIVLQRATGDQCTELRSTGAYRSPYAGSVTAPMAAAVR
jgi:hypothetical protein